MGGELQGHAVCCGEIFRDVAASGKQPLSYPPVSNSDKLIGSPSWTSVESLFWSVVNALSRAN